MKLNGRHWMIRASVWFSCFAVSNDHEYARNHMLLLADIARKLGNDEAVERLLQVENVEELKEIFAGNKSTTFIFPSVSKEEKKGSMIARVAPDLDARTFWLYKNAHLIDQEWVVRSAGIRQRHIDQAQSVNLYITNEFTLRQVLMLYIHAWEYGVKTIYYVRSKSLEVEECESCAS